MQTTMQTVQNGIASQENTSSAISAARAVARANGYLSKYVGVLFGAEDPLFFPLVHPIWQVSITFKMNDIGPFTVGLLDIDAATGEVFPLPQQQIALIQERTDAYLTNHTLSPTTAG